MSVFLVDVEGPDHEAVVRSSLNKMELLKSQIRNSQILVDMAEEEVRSNIEKLRDGLFLSQQSHVADLIWVVGELKGVLAHWGEEETPNAATKDRVQQFVRALDNKIKES